MHSVRGIYNGYSNGNGNGNWNCNWNCNCNCNCFNAELHSRKTATATELQQL